VKNEKIDTVIPAKAGIHIKNHDYNKLDNTNSRKSFPLGRI